MKNIGEWLIAIGVIGLIFSACGWLETTEPPEPNMLTPYRFALSEDGEVQLPNGHYLKTMKVTDQQTNRTYIYIEGMGFLETTR